MFKLRIPTDCFVQRVQHLHVSQLLAERDGSLAGIQPIGVQQTAQELTPLDNVHPHFAYNEHAPVRVAGIETETLSHRLCHFALVG